MPGVVDNEPGLANEERIRGKNPARATLAAADRAILFGINL